MQPACNCRNTPCSCGGRLGPGLVGGVLLIGIGAVLLLDRFGILDAHDILRYWPVILIVIGVCNLLKRDCPGSRVGGTLLTALGVILLVDRLGYWHVRIWDLWPLILIAVGLALLWKAIEGRKGPSLPPGSSISRLDEWVIFGGVERRINSQEFEGGRVLAIFGGVEIDLTPAAMRGNQAVIEANAIFGGVELRVPENWNVTVQGVGVFGGYADQTRRLQVSGSEGAPQLIVRGGAVFGGVEVRN